MELMDDLRQARREVEWEIRRMVNRPRTTRREEGHRDRPRNEAQRVREVRVRTGLDRRILGVPQWVVVIYLTTLIWSILTDAFSYDVDPFSTFVVIPICGGSIMVLTFALLNSLINLLRRILKI